jgi:crossover junction endodeoxyribonuclease RuvC
MRRVIGVDPGALGGLGVLDLDNAGELRGVALYRTPRVPVLRNKSMRLDYDPAAMRELLARLVNCPPTPILNVEVALEAQGARPGQGVASSYRTGVGFGLWLGLLVAARVAYHVVTPQAWKKHTGLVGAAKHASRLRVQERFPSLGVVAPADEGPAEALLLAAYLAATQDGGTHGTRGD